MGQKTCPNRYVIIIIRILYYGNLIFAGAKSELKFRGFIISMPSPCRDHAYHTVQYIIQYVLLHVQCHNNYNIIIISPPI